MKTTCILGILIFLLAPLAGNAQQVSVIADESRPINERMDWALKSARGHDGNGIWVGYSVSKFMQKNSWMGRIGGQGWSSRKSLYALLGKAHLEEELPVELRKNLNFTTDGVIHMGRHHAGDALYLREIGVLLYFSSRKASPSEIRMTNMSLGVDLKGKPLFWLGKSADGESTDYLKSLFTTINDEDFRSDLLRSISIHKNREANFDFLAQVLKTDQSEEIREDAAFWIGQLDVPEGLALLTLVVETDKSLDVREKAVFAIGQMSSSAALDKLIDLARNEKNREVRKQAIFWLGQKASKNATQVLEMIVFDEADTEVQGHAVHALAQMPADRSIPKLIEIATNHPNVKVRKKAIFWLGDSGDPRAVDVLIELAQRSGKGSN